MARRWGLVGRAEELALLTRLLTGEQRRGAVLSGAAGVGKTRLAVELVEHAAAQDRATAWTVGTRAMASVPFGAFAHLLPHVLDTEPETRRMLRDATDEFRRRSPDRPVLLGVDDAHLLDERSAELTHHLAESSAAFVVVTVRRGESPPGPISALWSGALAERIELQPLSAVEVGDLLSRALGGQVDTTTHHRLWRACAGNVLFLRELVHVGLERGTLAERDGVWSWSGELGGGERLTELVEDRLAGLHRSQRAALEVLAVGEPLPASVFAAAVGRRVVEQLERRSLVAIDQQGRRTSLRLTQPLYAETLRAGLGPMRRQMINRQLADALAGTGVRRRDDVLRLALWRLDGGGSVEPATMIAAARWARSAFELPLAERLARAALDGGGGAEAAVLLGDVLHWQGRNVAAWAVLERHVPDARQPELLAQWALVASSALLWGLGEAARAERIVTDVNRHLPSGPSRDRLAAHRAMMAHTVGRSGDALSILEPVLARADADTEVRIRAHYTTVFALSALGRCDEAIRMAGTGLILVRQLSEQRDLWLGEFALARAMAYCHAGRYQEMADLAGKVYREVVREPRRDVRGLWAQLQGRAALGAGRVATARARLREAVALLREQDIAGLLAWALCCLARAAALGDDLDEAQRVMAEHERVLLPALRTFDGDADLARAWVAAAGGEHSTARRLARLAADRAAEVSQWCVELEALHDAVRLGEPNLHARLAEAAARTDNVLAPVFVAHAAGLACGDGLELDRCAERFAELGTPLLAAEAAAAAAAAHDHAGRAPAARRSRARSAALAAICEGASTPGLRRSAPSPAALTAREREIADLATRGMSKREIADRLVLSIRTVGNHLNHIYAKLGITGRTDLAAALGSRPGSARTDS